MKPASNNFQALYDLLLPATSFAEISVVLSRRQGFVTCHANYKKAVGCKFRPMVRAADAINSIDTAALYDLEFVLGGAAYSGTEH